MERIREILTYKDIPLTICFAELKPIEQYECIRLLLATRTNDVILCIHANVNSNVNRVLEKLGCLIVTTCPVT